MAGRAPADPPLRRLRRVQGGCAGRDRSQLPRLPLPGGETRDPAGGNRLGRRPQGRHSGADEPETDTRRGSGLPDRPRTGLRRLRRRRRARLSAAHPRLARDVQRCRRRRSGVARLLHALRLRHPVRHPRPGAARALRVRLVRSALPVEQVDVRRADGIALEPVHRPAGGRRTHRFGNRTARPAGGDRELGIVAARPPGHHGVVAGHRVRTRLPAGPALRRVLRQSGVDVPGRRARPPTRPEGPHLRAPRREDADGVGALPVRRRRRAPRPGGRSRPRAGR